MLKKWGSLVGTGVMLSALVLFATADAAAQTGTLSAPSVSVQADGATHLIITWPNPAATVTDTADPPVTTSGKLGETGFAGTYDVYVAKGTTIPAGMAPVNGTTPITAADIALNVLRAPSTGSYEAGTEYAVQIVATLTPPATNVTARSSIVLGMTEYADPMVPTKPTLTATGYDSLRVRWTANTDAASLTGYTLYYRAGTNVTINDGDAKRMSLAADALEANLTDLMPGTTYAVALSATNPKGTSVLSGVATEATDAAPTPDRVSQPTLTEEGDRSLTFDWSAPAAGSGLTIERYMVQFQKVGDASWLNWNPSPTMGGVTLTGLTNGTTYRIQVKAVNSVGGVSEEWSIPTSGTPMVPTAPPPPPEPELAAPTGVMATGGDGMIEVSWGAVEGADSYEVSWMQVGGTATTTAMVMTGTSYTIENVMNGTAYSVQVSAMKGDMKSPASDAVTATPMAAPLDAPMNVMLEAGDGMIMASWDAVNRADSYKVSWTAGGVTASATVMGTSYTIENLMNGTEYSVTVSAMMGDMEGPASTAMMATPMPADPVPALPLFGMLALGAGLVAAGRRRLRAQRLLNN